MPDACVIALGGHALIRPGQSGSIEEQELNLRDALRGLIDEFASGTPLVITHGNGPQVGTILARSEAARGLAYDLPLDVCVAQSQGEIGYLIQQALSRLFHEHGIERPVAVILTRTIIDTNDPALHRPTKPIGPFHRKVPSPVPVRIVEAGIIRRLFEENVVVVAAGGGGIPVREKNGELYGVEAVVDKDLASAALALSIGAARILDLTSVDRVYLNYGTPQARPLSSLSVEEARRFLVEGHFPPGSMGPKIEAAVHFLERGGREVVITLPELARDPSAGTHIFPGGPR